MIKSLVITINHHHISIFIFVIFSLFLISCSSSEEIGKEKEDDIYIFDEVPPEDSYIFEKPVSEVKLIYMIQIGAFSTKESAEYFADRSRNNLNRGIVVSYNDDVNLYVVRLEEMFNTKIEAERVRANLWQMEEYNDAWIIPMKEQKK